LSGGTRAPLAAGKINPSGLTAVQTGPRQGTLSWQPVAGVLGYGITGPGAAPVTGLPFAGDAAATVIVTNVPPGSQRWSSAVSILTLRKARSTRRSSSRRSLTSKVTLTVVAPALLNPAGLTACRPAPVSDADLAARCGRLGYGVTGRHPSADTAYLDCDRCGHTLIVTNVPAGNQRWTSAVSIRIRSQQASSGHCSIRHARHRLPG
jgi:hypothetical protein